MKKQSKGITLVALVITIIILLILAGLTISSLTGSGLFEKAEIAADKYKQAQAQEILELVLQDAQLMKYNGEGLTDDKLKEKINEVGEVLPTEGENITEEGDIIRVIVEGYIFDVDKTIPKIVDCVGKADGIIITAIVSNNATNGWISADESEVTIKGIIKTYSGGKVTEVSAKRGETPIKDFSINEKGEYEIKVLESGTYTLEGTDNKGKTGNKIVPVQVKIDFTAPTITNVTATELNKTITISATGNDEKDGEEQSGLDYFTYTITPSTGVNKATGTFTSKSPAQVEVTDWVLYTIKVTATDKCKNMTETPVEKKIDMSDTKAPTITSITAEALLKEISISAEAIDDRSGLDYFSYEITPATGIPTGKNKGTFKENETVKITSTEIKTYTIIVTATDKATNTSEVTSDTTKKVTTTTGLTIAQAKSVVTDITSLRKYLGVEITDYKPTAGGTWRIYYYDYDGYFNNKGCIFIVRDYTSEIKSGSSTSRNNDKCF